MSHVNKHSDNEHMPDLINDSDSSDSSDDEEMKDLITAQARLTVTQEKKHVSEEEKTRKRAARRVGNLIEEQLTKKRLLDAQRKLEGKRVSSNMTDEQLEKKRLRELQNTSMKRVVVKRERKH